MKIILPFGRLIRRTGGRVTKLSRKQQGLLLLAVAAILSLLAVFTSYQRTLQNSSPTLSINTEPVKRGQLISTLNASGSVVATRQTKLSFNTGGKLVELNVALGDAVKAGQPLAQLESLPLKLDVETAESNLRADRIKLRQAKEGATPEERAAAKASYEAALVKYQEVIAGPMATDLEAAQSSVEQAQANLASAEAKLALLKAGANLNEQALISSVDQARANLVAAEAKLEQLNEPTQADWAAAVSELETKRAALKTAQSTLDQLMNPSQAEVAAAQSAVNAAKQAVITAEDLYEMAKNDKLAESGFSSVSAAQQNYETARATYEAKLQEMNKLLAGSSDLELQSAQATLEAAQNAFDVAQAKVDQMKKGPTTADLATAQAAVDSAKANLATAQAKLDQHKAGSVEAEFQSAQSSVDQARATLATARGKLKELQAGPKASEVESARSSLATAESNLAQKVNPPKEDDIVLLEEQVRRGEIALERAKLNLQNATLVAPFDGTVASVTPNVGEQVSGVVITLVDPKSIRIDVTIDENDVVKVATGQPVTVTFDAAPDVKLAGQVTAVSPAGNSQQGIVTYLVSVTPEPTDFNLPAGLTAIVSIETARRESALMVPSRAVRTTDNSKTVEVLVGGKTETRTVEVGISDDQYIEIVSGLAEGELVVNPTGRSRSGQGNLVID